MKSVKLLTTALAGVLLLVTGCNSVTKIGEINGISFYKLHMNDFAGPAVTGLITVSNGTVRIESLVSVASVSTPLSAPTGLGQPGFCQPSYSAANYSSTYSTASSASLNSIPINPNNSIASSSCPGGNCTYIPPHH